MSTPSYVPAKQGDFLAWLLNFTTMIQTTPAQYGLTAPQAAGMLSLLNQYQVAYAAALTPETRTKSTVAAKDNARVVAEAEARTLGQLARNFLLSDPTPANYERIEDLGLRIPDPTPTPIEAPESYPVIQSLGTSNGRIMLSWRDSLTPNSRRRPAAAIGAQLWGVFGEVAAVSTSQMEYLVQEGKSQHQLEYDQAARGKIGSFGARWVTARGLTGPWSEIFVSYLA